MNKEKNFNTLFFNGQYIEENHEYDIIYSSLGQTPLSESYYINYRREGISDEELAYEISRGNIFFGYRLYGDMLVIYKD